RAAGAGARPAARRQDARGVLPRRVRSGGGISTVSRTSRRTLRCGELRAQQVGQRVRLGGWVHRRRDLGGIVFIDLRDRAGLVQVAFGPDWASPEVLARAGSLGGEDVVAVAGAVVARPAGAKNPEMASGDIAVHATGPTVISVAATPA